MGRILKSIAPYWRSVIIILVLLILQANGDLALPQYTSDIIDVGIQNGGIGHSIPEKITKDEYDIATMFMTDEEGNAVADEMFLNFWWTEDELASEELIKASAKKAEELGLDPYQVFAGVDI